MAEYDVRLFDTLEDLNDLREDWNRLLAVTSQAAFFQTMDWLRVYWRHYGDRQQLRVLVVTEDGQPIGILPLTISWETSRLGSVRVLGYPLDNWGTSYGPIGPQPLETLVAALSWLRQGRRDWDILDLRWTAGHLVNAVETALRRVGLSAVRETTGQLSWVDLTTGWDAYWASRSPKFRSNVRRCEKRLAARGSLAAIHCRPTAADPRWDVFDLCQHVAAASWQATATNGNTISDAAVRDFLREVHGAAAAQQATSMNLLTLDGKPIAFSYDYVFRNHVYGLRTGYDPAFAESSPGSVLLARSLQDGCRRGDLTVDLGETPAAYKAKWRTRTSTSFRFCHYPRGDWRAQALRWKRRLLEA